MEQQTIIEKLEISLPDVFGRTEVERLLPGIINSKTLANLDSAGKGPSVYYKHGRKVVYEKEAFLQWLSKRIKRIEL
ncbi:MAG: hypothetical protein HGB26_05565 [Desulfobulbaceae bacterium]|nr:hypothetical protein [Desulfobulbaceae bacterium]